MQEGQHVILKGRKDGIAIELDGYADFEPLKQTLRKKVVGAKKFFEGARANVAFEGRTLTAIEEKELLDIILNETTLDVSYADTEDFDPPNTSFSVNSAPSHLTYSEQMTSYHQGGLRSGQSIHYNGSVVVMGDVNPGSEIIAGGNVIVLGALKGMVHAGCGGDNKCFISALSLMPTQLRIANIITYIPQEMRKNVKQVKKPACAYIQDGQIYIAPLVN